ncbi:MAG: hypothetical protein J6I46_15390 [Ruminococcus sp.]|nr:hypothetical protein [Ruminococcus sp.]
MRILKITAALAAMVICLAACGSKTDSSSESPASSAAETTASVSEESSAEPEQSDSKEESKAEESSQDESEADPSEAEKTDSETDDEKEETVEAAKEKEFTGTGYKFTVDESKWIDFTDSFAEKEQNMGEYTAHIERVFGWKDDGMSTLMMTYSDLGQDPGEIDMQQYAIMQSQQNNSVAGTTCVSAEAVGINDVVWSRVELEVPEDVYGKTARIVQYSAFKGQYEFFVSFTAMMDQYDEISADIDNVMSSYAIDLPEKQAE